MLVRASLGWGRTVTEVAFVEDMLGEVGVLLHPAQRRPLAADDLVEAGTLFLVANDTSDERLGRIHAAGFAVARVREAHALSQAVV